MKGTYRGMIIKKKANGKYQVKVYVGYDKLTGKRQTKYATCGSMKEARLKETEILTAVHNGEVVPKWEKPKQLEHLTFDDVYKMWFEVYKQQDLANSTISLA